MYIASSYETIIFEVKDSIGYLTINREAKLNALNSTVLNELRLLLNDLIDEDCGRTVKGIIFTGSGEKAFIAGADISQMPTMDIGEAREFGALGQDVTLLFERLPIPVIACVNGFALGGGSEMAMACDFIYAIDSAVFGLPEVKLGLIPGFGGTQRLAKLIGRNFAKEIIYTGRNVLADEAKHLGLVTQLFESKEDMIAAAEKTLKLVMRVSPKAIKHAKKVMNEANDLIVSEGLQCELEQFSSLFGSDEMLEGTTAFLEKRKPDFTKK